MINRLQFKQLLLDSPERFKELLALINIPQDIKNHPEGNAFEHTLYVLEAANEIDTREKLSLHDSNILIYAAMCHDLGKVSTTEVHDDGRITSYGHDDAGIIPARDLLERLHINPYTIDNVLPLVKEHMAHLPFKYNGVNKRAVRRLAYRLQPSNIEMWALLVEADMSGRPPLSKHMPDIVKEVRVTARLMDISKEWRAR